jgi:hypothetical protein
MPMMMIDSAWLVMCEPDERVPAQELARTRKRQMDKFFIVVVV